MKRLLVLFLLSLSLAACTSTYVTRSWTKPNARPAQLRRIAVLAMLQQDNRILRQQMEEAIASELVVRGYNAYSTFQEFGPQRFDRTDEQAALNRLKKSNTDAVLTVVLLDKAKERYYVPGRVTYTPAAVYYNRFWGYYSTVYDRMYTPGYYTTNTNYFWESNLYDLNQPGDDLIYSAQSESFDPASAESLGRQYAKTIVKDMIRSGLIQK